MAIVGGCFCGTVRYEVSGPLRNARACHCSRCRKAFSSASSAYAEVPQGAFRWTRGQDQLTLFATTGEWGLAFCRHCGTTLAGLCRDEVHGITLGSVDGDPGVEISMHIFVESKAPWDHIGGDAPRYPAQPPG
jgi:hypothetical protein